MLGQLVSTLKHLVSKIREAVFGSRQPARPFVSRGAKIPFFLVPVSPPARYIYQSLHAHKTYAYDLIENVIVETLNNSSVAFVKLCRGFKTSAHQATILGSNGNCFVVVSAF